MNLLNYYILTPFQAGRMRGETANDAHQLDPRMIEAGPHKGQFALERTVSDDPAFAERKDMFLMLKEVELDTDVVFPPSADA